MANKIVKKYNVSAQGILSINNGELYISIEDGIQDVNIAKLLEDFDGKPVKISCSYDEDYEEPDVKVDLETGEVVE